MAETVIGSVIAAIIPVIVLIGLAFAYLSLRIRDGRAETPDPELGVKSAYHAFFTAGVLLALTGLTISVVDFLGDVLEGPKNKQVQPQFNPKGFGPQPMPVQRNDDPFDSISQRIAWPLVISGALFSLISLLLIKLGSNDSQFPAVRRTFTGMRLVYGGLNVMGGLTILIQLLFQKEFPTLRPFAAAIGVIGVWLPASAIHVFFLKKDGKLPYFVPPKPKRSKQFDLDEDEERDEKEDRPKFRRRPKPRREEDEEEDD